MLIASSIRKRKRARVVKITEETAAATARMTTTKATAINER